VQFDSLYGSITAMADLIVSIPAVTINDICAQAVVIRDLTWTLNHLDPHTERSNEGTAPIRRAAASIALAAGRLGGVDLATIGWGNARESCAREFQMAGV